jgi:hypothetical protein
MGRLLAATVVLIALSLAVQPALGITVAGSTDANTLKNALFAGGGAGINMATATATLSALTVGGAVSSGTYTNISGTYGIGSGVILSTGNVLDYADGPNTVPNRSTNYGASATPSQTAILLPITGGNTPYDVTQLDISFDMLPGYDTVYFNTVFGSEEYPEYVGTQFVDGFGLLVNGTNIAFVGGLPVNINNGMFVAAPGTELDGILDHAVGPFGQYVQTFNSPVNPTGNVLTFIICDASDNIYDSTIYISQLGGTTPEPVPEPLTLTGIALAVGMVATKLRRRLG